MKKYYTATLIIGLVMSFSLIFKLDTTSGAERQLVGLFVSLASIVSIAAGAGLLREHAKEIYEGKVE